MAGLIRAAEYAFEPGPSWAAHTSPMSAGQYILERLAAPQVSHDVGGGHHPDQDGVLDDRELSEASWLDHDLRRLLDRDLAVGGDDRGAHELLHLVPVFAPATSLAKSVHAGPKGLYPPLPPKTGSLSHVHRCTAYLWAFQAKH